ncbi:MAG TPA: PASTA domain-containing protein [Candidatus Eremiobacteraceae bacterium]|nr:PASTA domain-containing protein [Candidatus Eremiobacteraceae bacterium]
MRDRMGVRMSLRERIRTLFRLFLLSTVLVTVALLSAITTIRLTIRGHQETMPNMVGLSFDYAQRMASGLGLEMKVEDKLFNTQYPPQVIVSQMPPPGTRIKIGQHVHVLVSLGPPQVVIPNFVGASIRAARITAIQRNLELGDVVGIHWHGVEPDQVVAQDPPPESAELRTPAVNILVSVGEEPTSYLCPKFLGQPIAEARRSLERAGFKVADVTSITTQSGPRGVILTQSPAAGSKIDSDAMFSFEVSQ